MTSNLETGIEGQSSADYGDLFWKIGLPDGRQISVHADTLDVDNSGALHATAHSRSKDHESFPELILAAGQWEYAYASNAFDGTAIIVDHISEG